MVAVTREIKWAQQEVLQIAGNILMLVSIEVSTFQNVTMVEASECGKIGRNADRYIEMLC